MTSLETLCKQVLFKKKQREMELQSAFRRRETLPALIERDACRIIAAIGGYPAPLDNIDEWIELQARHNAVFLTKAKAVGVLLAEYVDAATHSYEDRLVLAKACAQAANGMMLDVQKECIAQRQRANRLEAALKPFVNYIKTRIKIFGVKARICYPELMVAGSRETCALAKEDWEGAVAAMDAKGEPE